ncbi:terminase large subunit [Salmonella phage 19]|nr:terminase large subunit [Salmonella phage 19]
MFIPVIKKMVVLVIVAQLNLMKRAIMKRFKWQRYYSNLIMDPVIRADLDVSTGLQASINVI